MTTVMTKAQLKRKYDRLKARGWSHLSPDEREQLLYVSVKLSRLLLTELETIQREKEQCQPTY